MRGRAAMVAAMLLAGASGAGAQIADSVPTVRHILAIDFKRLKPFRRSYDMVVHSADSARVIGRRDVSLEETTVADSSVGWMLVESRSGAVRSLDSILFAYDLRPVRWRSVLGSATLDIAFSTDSLSGTIRAGAASVHVAGGIPPDLVVSPGTLEALASLMPLAAGWTDSVNALSITFGGASVEPSELVVAGEDSVTLIQGVPARATWVLSMRSGSRETRMWVDRETGDVLRAQQLLPSHVGAVLEYRMRPQQTTAP